MAAHSVKMRIEHALTVGNLGVEFEVRHGGKLLGKLEVTQSTIEWTPAKARNPRKVSWQEFGDWMEDRGNRRAGTVRPAPAAPDGGHQQESLDVVDGGEVEALDGSDQDDGADTAAPSEDGTDVTDVTEGTDGTPRRSWL